MRGKFSRVFLLVTAILSMAATAQAEYPVIEWVRQLGTSDGDFGESVSVDSSGNAYVTGSTWGDLDGNTNAGSDDMFLSKYDTNGCRLWTRLLGTESRDAGLGVSIDSSGNAYVAGCTEGDLDGNTSAGSNDIFLTKYDTHGVKLWTRQQGTANYDAGLGLSLDDSGNVYVTGYTKGSLDGNTVAFLRDIFLTKYDTNGVKLWTRQLGTYGDDRGYDVSVDSSGNAYVTGYTQGDLDGNTSEGSCDMFLIKYNTDGAKLWTRQLGSTDSDEGWGVSVDNIGNAYITGYTYGDLDGNINIGHIEMFLTKYDTDGVKLWTRQRGTSGDGFGYSVSVDSSGNAYVTGGTYGDRNGNTGAGDRRDMFLAKYDTDGVKLWTQQLGTTDGDWGQYVSVDDGGNAYVTGYTEGSLDGNTNAGGWDMFLCKISTVPEPGSIAMLAGIALTIMLGHLFCRGIAPRSLAEEDY